MSSSSRGQACGSGERRPGKVMHKLGRVCLKQREGRQLQDGRGGLKLEQCPDEEDEEHRIFLLLANSGYRDGNFSKLSKWHHFAPNTEDV